MTAAPVPEPVAAPIVAGPIVAGIGCRRHCPADAIVALVHQAEHACGHRVALLAAPAFKRGEPGLHAAAAALGLELRFIGDAALALAQPRCPTRSPAALAATGHASIAEAAALAASGGALILPRIAARGVTCAIAARGVPCAVAAGVPCAATMTPDRTPPP